MERGGQYQAHPNPTTLLFLQSVEDHAELFKIILSNVTKAETTNEMNEINLLIEEIKPARSELGLGSPAER